MEDLFMKKFFKTIQKDSILSWSFWTTILFTLLMSAIIAASLTTLPPFLPLYNQMPWGYARLGRSYELFLLPAGILAITIGNTLVGAKLVEKIPLLARFLFITMVVLAFFTFIFIIRIIFLVI